ncbi:hypothetical protein C8035_v001059 [Colletotrichum spinosum]|uniref:Uncharacterized protein n=1 Tax=Colletotrichum spinosum TaxID=1347390 RepID=A0A4R8Q496_9PEZI|nr:hypothetical protein C8035_v001059 [Colletotrichum spinosum]
MVRYSWMLVSQTQTDSRIRHSTTINPSPARRLVPPQASNYAVIHHDEPSSHESGAHPEQCWHRPVPRSACPALIHAGSYHRPISGHQFLCNIRYPPYPLFRWRLTWKIPQTCGPTAFRPIIPKKLPPAVPEQELVTGPPPTTAENRLSVVTASGLNACCAISPLTRQRLQRLCSPKFGKTSLSMQHQRKSQLLLSAAPPRTDRRT